MVAWYHRLYGHEQALGVGDGQGSLGCCSPWGRKQLDIPDESQSPEALLERSLTKDAVRRGLQALPAEQRQILYHLSHQRSPKFSN